MKPRKDQNDTGKQRNFQIEYVLDILPNNRMIYLKSLLVLPTIKPKICEKIGQT